MDLKPGILRINKKEINLTGIRSAVTAGVDSIEHGFQPDRETLQAMKQKGTFLVLTVGTMYPMLEEALRRSLLISQGSPFIFFKRPISAVIILTAIFMLASPFIPGLRKRREKIEKIVSEGRMLADKVACVSRPSAGLQGIWGFPHIRSQICH
jgi:hypothetical protein